MLGNNAAAWKEDALTRLSPRFTATTVERRLLPAWLPVPMPAMPAVAVPPGCYATPARASCRGSPTLYLF